MDEVYSFLGNISASKTNSLSLTLLCKGILLIVTVAYVAISFERHH